MLNEFAIVDLLHREGMKRVISQETTHFISNGLKRVDTLVRSSERRLGISQNALLRELDVTDVVRQ